MTVETAWDDVRHVGPATARLLEAADVDPADLTAGRVSHADLLAAGVNPGVAARLRREHSLSWSFATGDGDLDRRAAHVRGLGSAERAWVAASADDWQAAVADAPDDSSTRQSRGAAPDADARYRTPTSPAALPAVPTGAAARLADAGVVSVRILATVDPAAVAAALSVDVDRVRAWRSAARERRDASEREDE